MLNAHFFTPLLPLNYLCPSARLETTAVLGNASFIIEQLAITGEIVLLLKNQLANFNSMGSD